MQEVTMAGCALEDGKLPGFGTEPQIVQINGHEKPSQSFINPFGGSVHKANIPMVQEKTCLGSHGDWLLMFDEKTKECFLMDFTSQSKISLPPLSVIDPADHYLSCALSSPMPPDCTIMLSLYHEKFLLYCRPGDKEWSKLVIEFAVENDMFNCGITGLGGKIYVTTDYFCTIVINAGSAVLQVERKDIKYPWTCPRHSPTRCYLVESCGDIFLLQTYLDVSGVTNVNVHILDLSTYVWKRVESISDRTFFISECTTTMSYAATKGGKDSNCIHVLWPSCDGVRLYTISLDDMTIRFNLLPECAADSVLFWAVPSIFKQESWGTIPSEDTVSSEGTVSSEEEQGMEDGEEEQASSIVLATTLPPWSTLPIELVDSLVNRLSFIDFLHLRAVCKDWSLLAAPVQDAKAWPLLMTTCSKTDDSFLHIFDPVSKNEYSVSIALIDPEDPKPQALRFSRNGWVLLTEGDHCVLLVNPFTGVVKVLPVVGLNYFNGVSFFSVPESPDFMVVSIFDWEHCNTICVAVWRYEEEAWTDMEFTNDASFRMATHNPILFDGEFYCLGTDGRLGVFNPSDMTWRVLDKPEPLYDVATLTQENYYYLVEWRGQLISIIKGPSKEPIQMFGFDQSQMVWSKLKELKDAVLFLDSRDALARPPPQEGMCNKIYLSGFTEVDDAKTSAVYSLENHEYYPSFYGLTESVNAIWFEPNLDYLS